MGSEKVRLQKVIAHVRNISRRQAEELIHEGVVSVNGELATIGMSVDPKEDKIKVEGKVLKIQDSTPLVIAVNKPQGIVCTHSDPYHQDTIFTGLPKELQKEKLICAGRLDKASEGLVILTNDGSLAHKVMHPSGNLTKRYHVTLSKPFNPKLIPKLIGGIHDEGEVLKAKKILLVKKGFKAPYRLEMHLTQGRKREIRRMMGHFGYFVDRLQRHQIGKFSIKKVPHGSYRVLTDEDIEQLLKSDKT